MLVIMIFIHGQIKGGKKEMTVYEYIKQASKKQFQDFCFQLYNKGWFDGTKHEDDENWVFYCLPDITMEEWEEVE